MNYSQKKSIKFFSKMFSGVLPALFIFFVAVWFSGGIRTEPKVMAQEVLETEVCEAAQISQEPVEFLNPTDGVLTSAFGERWGRTHKGIDIGATAGTEIYAAFDGVVKYAGVLDGYGNYIEISHKDGFETAYAHCDSLLAKTGDAVLKGQLIAYVGSTGNSTGPHLHFEIRCDGEVKDPLEYVNY